MISVGKRSCGKVMFSQACVNNSVQGGGWGQGIPLGIHWRQEGVWPGVSAQGEYLPKESVCSGSVCPVGVSAQWGYLPWGLPPGPEADTHPPETSTAADGTHPTGMHSCFLSFYRRWEMVQLEFICSISRDIRAVNPWEILSTRSVMSNDLSTRERSKLQWRESEQICSRMN